jgi:hypothetical protein
MMKVGITPPYRVRIQSWHRHENRRITCPAQIIDHKPYTIVVICPYKISIFRKFRWLRVNKNNREVATSLYNFF